MSGTLPALLAQRVQATPQACAFQLEDASGRWQPLSWARFAEQVEQVGRGLAAAGLRHGDRLALVAPVSLHWELVHHAALALGAVVVGFDTHDLPSRIADMTEQADIGAFVVVDEAVLAEVGDERLGAARFVLRLPASRGERRGGTKTLDWDTLLATAPAAGGDAGPVVAADDLATIIFTSGTTGRPRGIAYTHGQVCLAVDAICATFSFVDASSRVLCWLPLSNLFQRIVNLAALRQGAAAYLLADPRRVMQVVAGVEPDVFVGVPRFFEKLLEGVRSGVDAQPPFKRWVARRAWSLGRHMASFRLRQATPPAVLRLAHGLAERLVLARLRASVMGPRLRLMVTGSAPIAPEVLREFLALGWLVLEAYGQSENIVPIAMNRPDDFCFGTVGRPVRSNEVVVGEDGSVRVRGPGLFSGYLGEPRPAGFDAEGFYTTGDLGAWDEHGHLKLIGRSSELFKTSTGRRIAPVLVEDALRRVPGIDQAMLVGAGRKYPIALCTLPGPVDDEARRRLAAAMAAQVAPLAEAERPRGVVLLDRPFDIGRGELTPNLKLRRTAIEALHAPAIEAMYRRLDDRPPEARDLLVG